MHTNKSMTGNVEFVRYVQQNQGRIYRLVNGQDQVPLLPPLDSYWQTYAGMWYERVCGRDGAYGAVSGSTTGRF